ncbi:MAG: CHAT domain-containing protein, partial [Gloeotrichia echinulata HAB0833]
NQCRLVVLSACETGLIDFRNSSDEYIGLPSGFLYAGSVGVVNSLWTVDDLSTAFLMIKFFQNFQGALTANQDMSVASALKEAQLWLRNASKEELQEWAKTLPLDGDKKGIIRRQLRRKTEEKPFKYPYHWAAFTAVGK